MSEQKICENCGLVDMKESDKYCSGCGEAKFLICGACGNERWFYSDVSIVARQLIDLKNGKEDEKVYDINKNQIDNWYDMIYCKKCDNVVLEA